MTKKIAAILALTAGLLIGRPAMAQFSALPFRLDQLGTVSVVNPGDFFPVEQNGVLRRAQISQIALQTGGSVNVCDPINTATCAGVDSVGLKVDASGATITVTGSVAISGTATVSGTITANAGSGTFSTSDIHLPFAVSLGDNSSIPSALQLSTVMYAFDATHSVYNRVQVDSGSGTLRVDASGQIVTTQDAHFPVSAPLTDNTQNPVSTSVAALGFGFDPVHQVWNRLWVDAGSGLLKVDASGQIVTIAGNVGGFNNVGTAVYVNPALEGCRAQNAENVNVGNGTVAHAACDEAGKRIVMPYANRENFLSGAASQTSTTQTTIISAVAAGIKIYVTGLQCFNNGSTTSTILLNDTSAWEGINPNGGGFTVSFPVPLVVAANTALKFTPGSSSTTQFCNAQGYSGS